MNDPFKLTIFLLLCCFAFQWPHLEAQENFFKQEIEWPYKEYHNTLIEEGATSFAFNFGLSFTLGKRQNNSLSAFVAVSAMQKIAGDEERGLIIGGNSKLILYRGGLGTSFFDQKNFKFNIDIRNTITLLMGCKINEWIGKPFFVEQGTNTSPQYDPYGYSFALGTTFINGLNHSRNQQIGSLSLAGGPFVFQYYNDGTPFSFIGAGDLFDRYWTGGGSLGYYSKMDHHYLNEVIIRYDNYTGFQQNLFNVAGLLNLNHMPYKLKQEQLYNQARFKYTVGIFNNNRFNFSIWEPIYWDIQNFIHYNISNDPFHARPFSRRYTIGYDYLNFGI